MAHALALLLLFCALGVVMFGTADASVVFDYEPPVSDHSMPWYQDNIPEAYEILLENGQVMDDEVFSLVNTFRADPNSICVERVTHSSGVMIKYAEPCDYWTPKPTQPGWYWALNDTRFDYKWDYEVATALLHAPDPYTLQEIARAFSDDPESITIPEEYVSARSERQPIEEAIEAYIKQMKWTGFYAKSDDTTGQSNDDEGITVYGTLRYTPWADYIVHIDDGVSNVKVCLLDFNPLGERVYQVIRTLNDTNACTWTNSSGYFSISNVNDTDTQMGDNSTIDLALHFSTISENGETWAGISSDPEDVYYFITTEAEDNLRTDTDHDASYTIEPSNTNHIFGAYDAVQESINFFWGRGHTGNFTFVFSTSFDCC